MAGPVDHPTGIATFERFRVGQGASEPSASGQLKDGIGIETRSMPGPFVSRLWELPLMGATLMNFGSRAKN
jgi:hypothetical protein